jgi:hypothetical protein
VTKSPKFDDHAWPFVGREDELAGFRRMLVGAGSCGLVLAGASGVGKTRTATACLAIASGEASCYPARVSGHPAATELVLSVRSVENRLQRVHEKLGICTRAALARALDLTAPWEGVHQLVKTN